jgi:hypothetical protein
MAGRRSVWPSRDNPPQQDGRRPSDHCAQRRRNGSAGPSDGTCAGARQQRARALRYPRLRGADYRSLTPAEELAHGVAQTRARNSLAPVAKRPRRHSTPATGFEARSQPRNDPPRRSASLRLHDLHHQAITEMAEAGASDATLMAVAGHMSRRMLEHYSHVRMAAKRSALEKLESGLMGGSSRASARAEESELRPYVTNTSQLLLQLFPLVVSS